MTDSLPIGSVIYNILGPREFLTLPGNTGKWMELRSDYPLPADCDLAAYWVGKPLPDGRGVFVRGMNQDQKADIGDTDGNRNVGEWQRDDIGSHVHYYNRHISHGWGGPYGDPQSIVRNDDFADDATQGIAGPCVGKALETRPRNIALHVYIKISN